VGNLLIREIQSHEIETQHPDLQRLMMSRKDSVSQIIKALVTVVTLVALTGGFRVITATLDDVFGLTRGAGDAVWPASCADRLIAPHLIDQILNVDLHRWTPVRGWNMGWDQYTTSSHSTTLESNKSVLFSSPGHGLAPTGCSSEALDRTAYERNRERGRQEV